MNRPADWQLPPGVDRGLWDYLHSGDMVAGYDAQMAESPMAAADVAFCEAAFPTPGRLIDLGCGTGRLAVHFARRGFECVGVDLSEEMLAKARANAEAASVQVDWQQANLVDLNLPAASFDYAACLFSTLGMVRGAENRAKVVANVARLLKPGGRFVLHVHNRYFAGLGTGRVIGQVVKTLFGRQDAGDVTMPQAYGGAPLTLHHFTKRELLQLIAAGGLSVTSCVRLTHDGQACDNLSSHRTYGYLVAATRP